MIGVKRLFGAALILLFVLAIVLIPAGIAVGAHEAYKALFVRPNCIEQTEVTVLYYENQLASRLIIGETPYTVVEMKSSSGETEEIKLEGSYGHQKGDVMELHYNPENMKQFYIGDIQYAPEPPAPPKTMLDKVNGGLDVLSTILMVVVGTPLILLALAEIGDAPQPDEKGNNS